jgi:hypothetical protein
LFIKHGADPVAVISGVDNKLEILPEQIVHMVFTQIDHSRSDENKTSKKYREETIELLRQPQVNLATIPVQRNEEKPRLAVAGLRESVTGHVPAEIDSSPQIQ